MPSAVALKVSDNTEGPAFGASDRIVKLRELTKKDVPKFCIDRAVLFTRSYKETEGEPSDVRRAKAFAKVLREMTIYIREGELIVGNQASESMAGKLFPELGVNWLEQELDTISTRPQDPFLLSAEDKNTLKEEVIPYWLNKSVEARIDSMLPKKVKDLEGKLWTWSISKEGAGASHFMPDWPALLKTGLRPSLEDAQTRLAELDFTHYESYAKANFYNSVIIVLEAIFDFAHRYAELAREMAEKETDPQRRSELNQIAENCMWVPEHPARTLWEALQSVWFVHLLQQIETGGFGPFLMRSDQYFYPFYRKDIDEGQVTSEQVQELIDSWWVKFGETTCVFRDEIAEYFAGFPVWQTVSLGGTTPDGKDACNELTHMMLDAELHVRLNQPELGARVGDNSSDDYLRHVAKVIIQGQTGKPMLLTDNAVIRSFMPGGEGNRTSGASDINEAVLQMLRDYAIIACGAAVPCGVAGQHYNFGETSFLYGGYPKYLELALNNGRDRMTGELIGAESGDPRKFTCFDDVLAAYQQQIEYIFPILVAGKNLLYLAHGDVAPCAFQSVLTQGSIEKGLDCTRGGASMNGLGHYTCGAADIGDELAAIKKLVFDDQAISMSELLDALDANFEGKEELRQMLLNRAPKYGNDDDYVDSLVYTAIDIETTAMKKFAGPDGSNIGFAGLYTISQNVPMGKNVGATPDGRKARQPIGEGGASPYQGRDKSGPTAAMKSVTKVFSHIKHGGVFNMRFSPQAVENEDGLQKFMSLMRAYNDMGGWHVQFNVLDNKTLRAAQEQPQDYKDLIVRVAGFSAFYTQLSKDVQDDLISRTEQEF